MPVIIDFHSHILPEMDDGSDSKATTLALLGQLHEQGVSVVCATPHYYRGKESISAFLERRQRSCAQVADGTSSPRILLGAEVAWFPHIAECEDLERLTLTGTKLLLLEMPFQEWPSHRVEEVLSLHLDRDFHVVLAHPERFMSYRGNRQKLERLADAGVSLQVNAGTLVRWLTRKQGLDLLASSVVPFLGSDCHNLTNRAPHIAQARQEIERKLGTRFLQNLDRGMARAVGAAAMAGGEGGAP